MISSFDSIIENLPAIDSRVVYTDGATHLSSVHAMGSETARLVRQSIGALDVFILFAPDGITEFGILMVDEDTKSLKQGLDSVTLPQWIRTTADIRLLDDADLLDLGPAVCVHLADSNVSRRTVVLVPLMGQSVKSGLDPLLFAIVITNDADSTEEWRPLIARLAPHLYSRFRLSQRIRHMHIQSERAAHDLANWCQTLDMNLRLLTSTKLEPEEANEALSLVQGIILAIRSTRTNLLFSVPGIRARYDVDFRYLIGKRMAKFMLRLFVGLWLFHWRKSDESRLFG